MKRTNRPFSKTWYNVFDEKAKEALVGHLKEKGHQVVSTVEDYNVDVVTQKDGYTYFNEAEVKTAWTGDWPTHWAEIRIPSRKRRLIEKYKEKNGVLNFYVFDKDLKKAWRIKDTLMTDDRIKEAKGKNIWKGETFFHIPYTEAELVEL
tara:strand:- start:566 stop:1012 length:447 start_codon:yes stop_codon:yes gene_type:complete